MKLFWELDFPFSSFKGRDVIAYNLVLNHDTNQNKLKLPAAMSAWPDVEIKVAQRFP